MCIRDRADINLCTTQAVDVITANPDIKGMFAVDETRTSGVGTALTQLGKEGEIILGGFDSNPDSAELMRNGTVQFLTVQQPYQMGYLSLIHISPPTMTNMRPAMSA